MERGRWGMAAGGNERKTRSIGRLELIQKPFSPRVGLTSSWKTFSCAAAAISDCYRQAKQGIDADSPGIMFMIIN